MEEEDDKVVKDDAEEVDVTTKLLYVFFKTFTLTQIFNTLNIEPTYMYKYSSSLSPVTHILIHTLIQIISHTYVTLEPQVKIVGSTERVPYRCVRRSRIVRHV